MGSEEKRPSAASETQSVHKHLVRGSVWAVAMRWSMRGIGFLNTMILARLLTPEDFGIVAMAMITYGLVIAFSELGVEMLIIRMPDPDRADYDTAWTFRLLQHLVIACLLLALAPFAAGYFDEPLLVYVIFAVAGMAAFSGLKNIGIVQIRKELDFAKDFRFELYTRVSGFIITISAAFILRSYWALIIGQAAGEVARVVLSYSMHAFRPKFSIARWQHFLGFSLNIMTSNIGKYLNERFDSIIVGGAYGTQVLGIYNLSGELSRMFATEIVAPVGRALLPVYSSVSNNRAMIGEAFLKTLGLVSALVLPIGFGLSAVANEFVAVVLGAKWMDAVLYLQWLGPYAAIGAVLTLLSGQILIVVGREKLLLKLMWVRVFALGIPALIASVYFGVEGILKSVVLSSAVLLPYFAFALSKALSVSLLDIAETMGRTLLSVIAMAIFLKAPIFDSGYAIVDLATKILSGGAVYVIVHIGLWLAANKPPGPEQAIERLSRLYVRSSET